ncbi:hypothetical protein KC872_02795, partial [Candidatus Kaiserbacteria bacterium]|nr:hypothetical protein [Candidatus Kaiserbacteria bacterium]
MISKETVIRSVFTIVIFLSITATIGIVLLLESKQQIFSMINSSQNEMSVTPFPVSVNLATRAIIENPAVENFFDETLASAPESKNNWWNKIASIFSSHEW